MTDPGAHPELHHLLVGQVRHLLQVILSTWKAVGGVLESCDPHVTDSHVTVT